MKTWLFATTVLVAAATSATAAIAQTDNTVVNELIVYTSKKTTAGLFGEKDVIETPFSITAYTAELIKTQQAVTIKDVLGNDASVRANTTAGAVSDQFFVRGYNLGNGDIAIDNLYGLTSGRRTPVEFFDRVEVFKGPNGILNGTAPSGNVAGVVNLVTKQATDAPLTTVTGSFVSDSYFGGHVDLGRRFGPDGMFGVRANVVYRDGGYNLGAQTNELLGESLALDFRKGPVKVFANYMRTLDRTEGQNATYTFSSVVLPAPDANTNPTPTWAWFSYKYEGGYVGASYAFNENWSLSARYGVASTYDKSFATINATAVAANGNFSYIPNIFAGANDIDVYDIRLAGRFDTGPLTHNVALTSNGYEATGAGARVTPAGAVQLPTNIYNPVAIPRPNLNPTGDYRRSGHTQFTSYAIADTISALNERLQLTLAARHQRLDVENYNLATQVITSKSDRAKVSPSAALLYKVRDNVSVYGSYTSALTPGPIPAASNCNFGVVFPPIRSEQYEVGAKGAFGGLNAAVAAFQITNPFSIQGPTQIGPPPCSNLIVDGKSRNRGVEANLSGSPIASLQLVGGVALYNAKLVSTQGGLTDGNGVPGVPDLQFNMFAEWSPEALRGVALNGRLVHTAKQWGNTANTQRAPSWTTLDIDANYGFEIRDVRYTLRAAVVNVGDKNYYSAVNNGNFARGAPRTLRASITAAF